MASERIVTVRDASGKAATVRVPKTRDWLADHQSALDAVEPANLRALAKSRAALVQK
jgi:hypothetical protein